MNKQLTISIQNSFDFRSIKAKVLNWVRPFNTFCFLDNHQYQISPHSQECLLGAGVVRDIVASEPSALRELNNSGHWWMGHLAYELPLGHLDRPSEKPDRIGFPQLYFFQPEILIRLRPGEISIEAENPDEVYQQIIEADELVTVDNPSLEIKARMTREEYLEVIRKLQAHILRGDCYEINYCQEFYAENAVIDPLTVYQKLSEISPNPFSGLYRMDDRWLICASPERFIRKQGEKILSQPIKGTARRAKDKQTDKELKRQLHDSEKDRAENVMVVDLVRNDLARICREGTVKVEELFGIYAFPQVYQMISTISGELSPQARFSEIIEAVFPMGSMTGAPKKRVMELIDQYELTGRGIFSGALGYIDPKNDFDFNVVIRSILYQSSTKYLSFLTGSGITFYSNPEQEWDECQVKAEGILRALGE